MDVEMIGESECMKALDIDISRWAATPYNILIEGETGSGKELVAKALCARSSRKARTLALCNCAALAKTLLESELFGHVKGAFTGAVQERKGLFVEADKGTLFLDEINSASTEFQANLLRAVESGEIYPVGSSKSSQVDVRVIAATNATIEKSGLRPDLIYRFHYVLRVPPLRARGDGDIELLARAFIQKIAKELQCDVTVEEDALHPFFRHGWPGNVRELKNAVRKALVEGRIGTSATITREQIERTLPGATAATVEPSTSEQRCIEAIADLVFAELEAGRAVTLDGLTKAKPGATGPGALATILIQGLAQSVGTYVGESSKQRAVSLRSAPTVNAMGGLIGLTPDQETTFAKALRAALKEVAEQVKSRPSTPPTPI
jgi:transcriptional regulator with GAF, ATPase, and Fis domain